MNPIRRVTAVAGALSLLATGRVSAHALGASRFETPVPLPLVLAGAGLTVVATAVLLTLTVDPDREPTPGIVLTVPAPLSRWARLTGRIGFLTLFVVAVGSGLTGRQVPENIATVFVWGVWLKGVALLAILLGDPWEVLSPWRTVYEGLCRLEGDDLTLVGNYPRRLGSWPAVAGFLVGVGILGNLTVVPRSPRLTALVLVGYSSAMLVGGVAVGREWFARADALAVLYRLFGRVAPLRWVRTDDGGYVIERHSPWRTGSAVADRSLAAFVVAAVYTVTFDGFTGTRAFQDLAAVTRAALDVGPGATLLLYTAGYLLFLAGFALVVWLTALVTRRPVGRTALAVVPTLIPIAAAYEVAHTYPFVVGQTATLFEHVSEALGVTVALDPLAWLSLPAFWGSQVAIVVAGHVIAVVASHSVLDGRRVCMGHVPLTVLMVGYTVLSLWVVSRPIVA